MVGRLSPATTHRRWVILLAIVCLLSLGAVGCGGDDDDDGGDETAATTEQTAEETTATQEETAPAGGGGNAAAGEQVFADTCASCHGAQGEGGVGPNLQESSVATDLQAVEEQVRNGGGAMPAFGDELSDQQISDVAAFVTESIAGQ